VPAFRRRLLQQHEQHLLLAVDYHIAVPPGELEKITLSAAQAVPDHSASMRPVANT